MSHMEYFNNKTVIITGAAGFIGSHLSSRLINFGAKVIGVDNFLTGRRENITELEQNPNFVLVQANVIEDPSTYLNVTPDIILHFASPASPPRYQAFPIETYLVNSLATHKLLQFLKTKNSKGRFLFASTSEVYGDPLEHPQKESYWGNVNPNGKRSCYDEAKRLGETICGVHQRDLDMDVRIIRIFNTYGPKMDPKDGRVIPNFIIDALKSEPFKIFGDGTQTRSYCFISDLIDAIVTYLSKDELNGTTINLGNPEERTILETAKAVHSIVNNKAQLRMEFFGLPSDDPLRRRPDITIAKQLLGWSPKINFEEGLKKTIEYYKAQL